MTIVGMTNSSREPYRPTLTNDADVTTMWRTIMQPLGWHNRRMYFMLVEPDGRPLPHITEVDALPDDFGRDDLDRFVEFMTPLAHELGFEESCSVAILLVRPGPALLTDADRELCRELYAAATTGGLRVELVHVGTDSAIVPAPMDEVLPRSA